MDPNLLPQDLRAQEEKEKQKSQKVSRVQETRLYNPPKERSNDDLRKSDKPKLSFWRWLLGFPNQSATSAVKLTQPATGKAVKNNNKLKGDWLRPDQGAELRAATAINKNIKSAGFWSGILGRPVSPIVIKTPEKSMKSSVAQVAARPANRNIEMNVTPTMTPSWPAGLQSKVLNQNKNYKRPAETHQKTVRQDSWLNIFKDLFSLGRKRRIDLKFASVEQDKIKSDYKRQPISPAKEEKKATRSEEKNGKHPAGKAPYHLVPKPERMGELGINLMPADSQAAIKQFQGEFSFLLISIFVPIILLAVVYGFLFFLQQGLNEQLAIKQAELKAKEEQIGDYLSKEKQNNQFASRLLAVKRINQEKVTWDNFFVLLEKYTLDGVYFTSLSADTSGILNLPGIADDYSVLSKQLALFRDADEFVKDFKISNAQLYSEGRAGVIGVNFQVRLVLNDAVLHNSNK